jgi:hypothetical protein
MPKQNACMTTWFGEPGKCLKALDPCVGRCCADVVRQRPARGDLPGRLQVLCTNPTVVHPVVS